MPSRVSLWFSCALCSLFCDYLWLLLVFIASSLSSFSSFLNSVLFDSLMALDWNEIGVKCDSTRLLSLIWSRSPSGPTSSFLYWLDLALKPSTLMSCESKRLAPCSWSSCTLSRLISNILTLSFLSAACWRRAVLFLIPPVGLLGFQFLF